MENGIYFAEEAKVRLGESISTAAAQQTMLYSKHVLRVANTIAKRTFSLYLTCSTDIIQGQVSYAIPRRPFRLGSVCITDNSGNVFPLAGITYEQADDMFYNWRNTNSPQQYQGVPQYYIDDGAKYYTLLPIANYSAQAALLVNGYFGIDKWWNMGDPCPLPDWPDMEEALIYGVCAERALELKKGDSAYASVQKDYEVKFEKKMQSLCRQMYGMNAARRSALPTQQRRLGSFQGWNVWGGGN
jgi:hypothetical protein